MKIDELIARLEEEAEWAEANEWETPITLSDDLKKAAETIRLLWEVAKDTTNEKYRMQIDEWSGNNDTQNAD